MGWGGCHGVLLQSWGCDRDVGLGGMKGDNLKLAYLLPWQDWPEESHRAEYIYFPVVHFSYLLAVFFF